MEQRKRNIWRKVYDKNNVLHSDWDDDENDDVDMKMTQAEKKQI